MATSSITHSFVISNPKVSNVLLLLLKRQTMTAFPNSHFLDARINKPKGNLKFNGKKEKKIL